MSATYEVVKMEGPSILEDSWNGNGWERIESLEIRHHMSEKPAHLPHTLVKMAYDKDAIYIMFRVEDRYVRAIAKNHQDRVASDSCVEFFFTPGLDDAVGYFNLEINCGGIMLFHHQIIPQKGAIRIDTKDCDKIKVWHSQPKVVDPEVTDSVTWLVAYRVPFDILTKYTKVDRPDAGVAWRANFYKCADATSHPHWLTWAPVQRSTPDFHVPECFGVLRFR